MLRDIALEAFEGVSDRRAACVAALTDVKTLAAIARGRGTTKRSPRRALSRVIDARALGSIARHARSSRFGAPRSNVCRITTRLLAVDDEQRFRTRPRRARRLSERIDLEQVASRAKNKSSASALARRWKEIDDRAAAEAAAAAADRRTSPPRALRARPGGPHAKRRGVDDGRRDDAGAARERPTAPAQKKRKRQREARRNRSAAGGAGRRAARGADASAREGRGRRRARLAELADEADAAASGADLNAARRRIQSRSRVERSERRHAKSITGGVSVVEANALNARGFRGAGAGLAAAAQALGGSIKLVARVEPLAAKPT